MISLRLNKALVDQFDKVAKMHNRDRTKEIAQLMREDIQREFPDWQPPSEESA